MDGKPVTTLFHRLLWSGIKFERDYSIVREQITSTRGKITIKARKFAKSVFIMHTDNYKYFYSDNYIDVEAGKDSSVIITSNEPFNIFDFIVTDLATEIES